MPSGSSYLDTLLFAALPYVVLVVFFLKTIERYRAQTFTFSSLSSQMLENQYARWMCAPARRCCSPRSGWCWWPSVRAPSACCN